MKLWWHKVTNWEYWSANIVYAPAFVYWIWLAFRFRSIKFYKYSNPAIKNGGLYDDCKSDIYNFFDAKYYPKTFLVKQDYKQNIEKILINNQLEFPLIVKPDVGLRGIMVKKVNSLAELIQYKEDVKANFLIQELCTLPNEIGLFYCRFPSQYKGQIIGITGKNFLTVTGNGVDTLETLLTRNPRFEMQIPKLRNQIDLNQILENQQIKCLVPFGNHNRGTEFLDGSHLISQKLTDTFNSILDKIEGFYYGRLDIRFNTFEELAEGENFAIIELNGAKSEPTHIYDPKYSFWHGQREIFRYQKIFREVISQAKHVR
jgi:hypothetical protein